MTLVTSSRVISDSDRNHPNTPQRAAPIFGNRYKNNRFLFNKTNRRTNFQNLFCQENRHFSDSSSAHHQEFSTAHSALVYVMQVS